MLIWVQGQIFVQSHLIIRIANTSIWNLQEKIGFQGVKLHLSLLSQDGSQTLF